MRSHRCCPRLSSNLTPKWTLSIISNMVLTVYIFSTVKWKFELLMRFCFRSLFYVYFSCHFSAFNGANIDRPKCLCPHRHRWIDVLPRFSWLLRCNSRVTMSFVSGKFTQKILKFSTMTMVISFVIEINLQTTQLD